MTRRHFLARTFWQFVLALSLIVHACISSAWAQAQEQSQDANPVEEVLFVPYPQAVSDAQLETTVYKPDLPGPWPLVVINHGSLGYANPHMQGRNRPVETARFFLDRGYLVVAPMR